MRARGIALMRLGRLAGRYPAAAAMVVAALVPYLALSAALAAVDAVDRPPAPHEPADVQPRRGPGERRLRGRDGARCAVRAASPAATDDGAVRGAAGDRIDPHRVGAGPGDVHRRPRAPGAVHEPAADRGRPAAGARVRLGEAALDRGGDERLHLRRGRARTGDRRDTGVGARVATAVLGDRRRSR